jgi:thiol-disulfide isomerase/thioredoxin
MDPKVLTADKVALVGIEQVTAEAHQAAARDAAERARKRGIEVFPYPEVGKTYEFAVKAADGKTVSSKDLRGKVVVIDWWATWCSPCMKLMPDVKDLHEKRRGDGLVVLGVNLDNDPETAKKACERLGLGWPQVFVPADEATQGLWLTAAGTESIPLVLVIDRKGVLRAVNPPDLKREVGALLDEAK